ncbi:MAG TPA: hypothetical protein VK853_05995 [Ilumatobacteraceae bacterium]|nr:hypothetical protein [Ilumatobacteraceae bacterium]
MRPLRALAAPLVLGTLVIVTVSCGDDDASSVTTASSISAGTSAPTTEPGAPDTAAPDTTESPTTDAPATTQPPSTTAPDVPDDGSCLVGEWVVTEEEMDAFYAGLMGTVEAPLTIDTTGSAPLTFRADGTYSWAPAFTLTIEVAGAVGEGVVSGSIDGAWTAADGIVTTMSDVNAIDVSITVNGVTFSGSDVANGLLNESPVNGVTYSCDGPVLDFKTADPGVTVPVTLTPA